MKQTSIFLRFFRRRFFALVLLFVSVAFPAFAQSDEDGFGLALGRISFSLDTDVLEDGSQTDFSFGYRYTPSTEGEIRLRYIKLSYNDDMYDLEESLTANDETTFEIFLLPFRYIFFNDSMLSFNAAAGVYYEYNTLKQHGYFNMPALAPDSLNIYHNNFSMHIVGPLAEAGVHFRTRPADIKLNAGIVPIFYLRRDQSMRMKPYMGTNFFDYSQDTSGSPYFYGEFSGIFFRFLSVSLLYEFARIDYDAIAFDSSRNWTTLSEELLSHSFKVEASVLLPLDRNFSVQVGYGHSFNTIELNSGTPVQDNKHYIIIGTKKMTF
jgi:hypothetical protein